MKSFLTWQQGRLSASQYLLMSYKSINRQTHDSHQQRIGDIALHPLLLKNCSFIPVCLCACSQVLNFRRLENEIKKKPSKPLFFFTAHRESFLFFLRGLWCQGYSEKNLLFSGAHLLSKPITTAPMLGWMGGRGGGGGGEENGPSAAHRQMQCIKRMVSQSKTQVTGAGVSSVWQAAASRLALINLQMKHRWEKWLKSVVCHSGSARLLMRP